jgi:CheY-like chemotaxis protein
MLSVVLADDDADDRYMFREAFKELRLDIHSHMVGDGRELLDYLKVARKLPDLIFLDLNMPLMNGFECLQALKKNPDYAGICIIIFSTSSREQDIERTFVLGANIYLVKPASFNELKGLLHKVILFNNHYTKPDVNRENFVMSLGTKQQ